MPIWTRRTHPLGKLFVFTSQFGEFCLGVRQLGLEVFPGLGLNDQLDS
jgi:hypothetical protein